MNFRQLLDGALIDGERALELVDPATGEVFARCPAAGVDQLERAVAAASASFPAWSAQSIEQRRGMLLQIAEGVESRSTELAALLTAEQGKPLNQAMFEVMSAAGILRAFAAMDLQPRTLRDDERGTVVETRRPLGVVAAITPWNFPLALLMHKLGPALLAGNTVVAKPAATTPLTTLAFAEICQPILPRGVLNVICDNNDLGDRLTAHPDIAKIAFTGSTATGRKVMATAAATLKRVTLELGGNDAAIVLDDVDVEAVAARIFDNAMVNAGQVCVAIKRVYVPRAMYDRFCAALTGHAARSVIDAGTVEGVTIGPVQNAPHFLKLKQLLEECRSEGEIVAGGAPLDRPGYFIPPTIVRDVADDARIVCEEQFGPILPVMAYDSVDEAITRANASQFGLAGSIWGNDRVHAMAVAGRLAAGTVWVNQHLVLDPAIPFRGARQSGIGAELGQEGLWEYTQPMIVYAAPVAKR